MPRRRWARVTAQGDIAIVKNLRRNEQIRISPIRLIDESDQQIGIVDIREAMNRARDAGMDLVEVAPQSRPPVCRIMDYGKFMYAQRKKEQKAKAHRHETALKEIRIKTPKIDPHDLSIKVNRARDFLGRGDRVQFTLRFRGRELAHVKEGRRVFQQISQELQEVGKVDQYPRFEGRRLTMALAPAAKPKPGEKPPGKPEGKPAGKPAAKPAAQAPPAQAAEPAPAAAMAPAPPPIAPPAAPPGAAAGAAPA